MGTMNSTKLQRNWKAMVLISHDFFHCWRQTVEETIGPQEAKKLVQRFWELVGQGTAEAYLKKNRDPDNVEDVVRAFVRASEVMGEMVRVETTACLAAGDRTWAKRFTSISQKLNRATILD